MVNLCRASRKRGGGVALLVKKNVNFTVRHDLTINCDEGEMLVLQLDKSSFDCNQNIIVGIVYRPPNTCVLINSMKLYTRP